jgi:monovalent cation:H+ antiporter-2, CPA2 family
MHDAEEFLTALTIVLGVAAVTTIVFQWLRQPVVLGYIIAGLIIGPHLPIPLIADQTIVRTLSELGVIMLMFGLGLEFSVSKLFRTAATAGITAVIQCSVMMLAGFLTAQALGWTMIESIFAGALIVSSSTTIIAKVFDEHRIAGRVRDLVVAILIAEDLIAVALIAVLTGIGAGRGLSAGELALVIGQLVGFLALLIGGGLFIVPRLMRLALRLGRPETATITAIGVCFAISLLAHAVGYSVALGAFIAGMLVAESGEAKKIEALVNPVRDMFGAVFFVSVGMMIDPHLFVTHWVAILAFTFVVIFGKLISVTIGAFLVGNGLRTSVAAGMSLSQIGEFAFIIAALGISLDATGAFIYPVAVAASVITALTTPWMIRSAGSVGAYVDRKLPKPLQTFVTLYEAWIERLRARRGVPRGRSRRAVIAIALDVVVVAAIVIAFSLSYDTLLHWLRQYLGLAPRVARLLVVVIAGAVALPFCIGILISTGRLALQLASDVVPSATEQDVDLGRAPRRLLAVTLQLAGVLLAGLPLVALTTPFLHGSTTLLVLGVAVAVLGVAFWRRVRDLDGHVRASAHVMIEALATQTASGPESGPEHSGPAVELPGISSWQGIVISEGSAAIGRSLAQLELRGTTGATVLAIQRAGGGLVPDAHEPLRSGDVLAVVGSTEALSAARVVLDGRAIALSDIPSERSNRTEATAEPR